MVDVVRWVSVIAPTAGVVGGLLRLGPDPRKRIKADLELAALFDAGSEARRKLTAHAEARAVALVERDQHHTRDWSGVSAAVFLLLVAAGMFVWAGNLHTDTGRTITITSGALFGLLGAYGFIDSIIKKPREPKRTTTLDPPA